MLNISKYLDKFYKKIDSNEILIDEVVRIFELYKIKSKKSELEIRDNTVYIKSSPQIKNKILIYKDKIIKNLNELGIKDIK